MTVAILSTLDARIPSPVHVPGRNTPTPAYDVAMKRRKPTRQNASDNESAYTCPTCGQSIVIPLDISAGDQQQYIEDCPVCCNPNVIHVEFFGGDEPPRISAEAESV